MSGAEAARLSDEALLDQAAAGEAAAFDALVERHAASLLRVIRLRVIDAGEAEDVLQQTFLAAWRAAGSFRGEASVRTWLFTIARNAAEKARVQAYQHRVSDVPLDELGLRAGWGSADPEALALAAERRDVLAAAFAGLDADAREVLTLRDLEGLSGDETAVLLGLSLPAMKSRLHRARLTLAARVREEVSGATPRA